METLQMKLFSQAVHNYKKIFPCGTTNSFSDCFTIQDGKLLFWFDTEDHSTHMVMENLGGMAASV
jgi:hypothetical protein